MSYATTSLHDRRRTNPLQELLESRCADCQASNPTVMKTRATQQVLLCERCADRERRTIRQSAESRMTDARARYRTADDAGPTLSAEMIERWLVACEEQLGAAYARFFRKLLDAGQEPQGIIDQMKDLGVEIFEEGEGK